MKYIAADKIRFVRGTPATLGGWDDEPVTASTAYVPERPDMEDTGLVDAEGRRLYREREFGFKPR